ncbi:glycosyl transferase family 2 [Halostagnicola kamekurae]|uniref:Glucosyl-3-phosphoglycerate synthase n=1 Tax=Halostagnicola kamekurae TaxID=619731 RepID=A0A1I6RW84_9EURY|nr:glycosyl transferase family 2 [Halostagnicola kamekurae]SFS68974.1 glucosyl-3-phosphoglycerate synthase [Halostagnicola kamekurae]
MEYVQERIATLHEFGSTPQVEDVEAALAETAVVVPMTAREHGRPAAERVFSELEAVDPAAVFVPVRAPADRIGSVRTWLESFDLELSVLWCNAPAVDELLATVGLDDGFGKGRDVWLALGPAAQAHEYVVVHDADARSYEGEHVARLLAPLTDGFEFAKGYYARVEDDTLYGRLFRLFYEPLVRAIARRHDEPIVSYLESFRYALAGEFAASADLINRLRPPRAWGLEVGTLGDAFEYAGFTGTAQVDLGRHEHDHRSVAGDDGLEGMSREVAAELLRVFEERGVDPTYRTLPRRYVESGQRLIAQYEADARFNGFSYDPDAERDQLERYAEAIERPGSDRRLPRWVDASLERSAVLEAARPSPAQRLESGTSD